jgi:hypothetical protein
MAGTSQPRRRVLLIGLDPMVRVGMARALAQGGAELLDETHPNPDALVRRVAESGPDAIVLGGGLSGVPALSARLRAVAPGATFMLWRTDSRMVAVLAPGAGSPRVIPAPTEAELSNELFGHSGKGETCPST